MLLLEDYWTLLSDPHLKQKDRRATSLERVRQMDQEALTDEFYEQFSQCINISELLTKIAA